MKKLLIFLVLALLLSGCTASRQYTYNETGAPAAMDNFKEADIIGRMNDIKNGVTPLAKPEPSKNPTEETSRPENAKQLENLAAEYDSATIKTNYGDITVKFYAAESPVTVNNFLNLAKAGFYNGTKFHRVIKDFMIQGGDPNSRDDSNPASWGRGGPGYQFQDEINERKLVRGSLAMANAGANTNGSQFFIVTAAATDWLDGKHTNFGYVASGMEAVEKINLAAVNENDRPTEDVVINGVELIKSGN